MRKKLSFYRDNLLRVCELYKKNKEKFDKEFKNKGNEKEIILNLIETEKYKKDPDEYDYAAKLKNKNQ